MKQHVTNPAHVPGARTSLLKTLVMDEEQLFPDSIRGAMLAVPCKRMLRAVYGSAWRAIAAWAWQQAKNDVDEAWCRLRRRFYLTAEEREIDEWNKTY